MRRDLAGSSEVLDEPVTAVRRQAIIGHIGFLLDELAAQHRLLDQSIWPAAAAHRPDLADLADRVRVSHDDLVPATVMVRNATQGWSRSAPRRGSVLSAVRELNGRIGPVIDQDAELLPLACADAGRVPSDRPEVDRRRPVEQPDPAGPPDLLAAGRPRRPPGRAAAAADAAGRMWILRNGFSGAYNRSSYLMWVGGGTGPAV